VWAEGVELLDLIGDGEYVVNSDPFLKHLFPHSTHPPTAYHEDILPQPPSPIKQSEIITELYRSLNRSKALKNIVVCHIDA